MLEAYLDIIAMLATVFGLLSAVGYFPQAFKMYRRRSSADISLSAYAIWLATAVVWTVYGIAIEEYPLIITSVVNVLGSLSVMVLYFRYKRKR